MSSNKIAIKGNDEFNISAMLKRTGIINLLRRTPCYFVSISNGNVIDKSYKKLPNETTYMF